MELSLSSYSNHSNKKVVTLTSKNITTSYSPVHIQLPLPNQHFTNEKTNPLMINHVQLPPIHRPQYKQTQPIRKTSTFDLVNKKKTAATCSDILNLMDNLKLPVTIDIYLALIKECTKTRDPFQATKLHDHIKANRTCPSLHLLNKLLVMYVSCQCFQLARNLFDKMPVRNLTAWSAIIAGCIETGEYQEAMLLFTKMQREYEFTSCEYGDDLGFMVSGIVVCVLKACAHTMRVELVEQIHGWITKLGYSNRLVLTSFLIRFYGRLGCFARGDVVFDHASVRNVVVWTARIANCCHAGSFDGAIRVFNEMGREGVKKNGYTLSSVLKACGEVKDDGRCGRQVHASAIKLRLDFDGYVQSSLIDMYGKYGLVQDARRVFEATAMGRSDASWNALLAAYVLHGYCIEAIKLVYEMKAVSLQPPGSLLNLLRLACGRVTDNETDSIVSC